ncbi:Sec-independent protein translocase subunit TatA [Cellulomonas sp. SLBN-39]|uniref:Sec-independent protein translocase subunit TatA n=1 Tax=Cellulomonas sp. SLBN-39 TaxID=2768446 RepID=UPI0011544D21|nr:Sec-independent protein translocase subunit TatA [Cellulomonas sp. SLBN-39]TQL04166.1 sec-independent protein translocase protein TatA [Cellulomonas sp. SLBN-39]
MLRNGLQLSHILIILVVVLLLFGANRLPGLAKSVGQSLKIFKSEVKDLTSDDDKPAEPATTSAAPSAQTPDPVTRTAERGTDVPPPPSTSPRA